MLFFRPPGNQLFIIIFIIYGNHHHFSAQPGSLQFGLRAMVLYRRHRRSCCLYGHSPLFLCVYGLYYKVKRANQTVMSIMNIAVIVRGHTRAVYFYFTLFSTSSSQDYVCLSVCQSVSLSVCTGVWVLRAFKVKALFVLQSIFGVQSE